MGSKESSEVKFAMEKFQKWNYIKRTKFTVEKKGIEELDSQFEACVNSIGSDKNFGSKISKALLKLTGD